MWFEQVFKQFNIEKPDWFMAHEHVAKIKRFPSFNKSLQKGKLILVTAMSPTPAGEGKTTTVIALTDAMNLLKKNTIATLRQPSVGPVFGRKGGATGGGKSSIIPRDAIDLGLTGDFYAVEAANNMIAALIDNHIFHNKEPHLNSTKVFWKRCLDMNDRALRSFNSREGKRGFVITAASELMAILSLSRNFEELKNNIGEVIIGMDHNDQLVKAKDLDFHKAAAILLRDALYPNLIQTAAGNPVIMHAGPFANIAQGTSSIIGTALALELGDYVITEAGFGAELGAEKFFNIKCRQGNFDIACTVIVATIRAIKEHGIENLFIHIENLEKYGTPVVVCLNKFSNDTATELKETKELIQKHGYTCEIGDGFAQGAQGSTDLANAVIKECKTSEVQFSYSNDLSIKDKVEVLAKGTYRAKCVDWSQEALDKLEILEKYSHLPICMAKTPATIGDNPKEKFIKDEHTIHIRNLRVQAGAGFIVVLTGDIRLLPGLPKEPRALDVDLDKKGNIIWG